VTGKRQIRGIVAPTMLPGNYVLDAMSHFAYTVDIAEDGTNAYGQNGGTLPSTVTINQSSGGRRVSGQSPWRDQRHKLWTRLHTLQLNLSTATSAGRAQEGSALLACLLSASGGAHADERGNGRSTQQLSELGLFMHWLFKSAMNYSWSVR
jgi:hypothetical protein